MVIEVGNLTKRFGATTAVDGISFQVERGEIVGFLGPNGAGKSTTMRILTCYLPATSGEARVLGRDVFRDSLAVRRSLGYMPEGVPLYPEMRVSEYLRFRAAIKGVPRRERRQRLGESMERCGVADVSRKLIGALSKGYRQRVGLADALLADPPLLILDEPTIGLDPNQVRMVRRMIRELGEKRTILISTHILSEVEAVCSRAMIIHRGRLVFNQPLDQTALGEPGASVVVEARGPADEALRAVAGAEGVAEAKVVRSEGGFVRLQATPEQGRDPREAIARALAGSGRPPRELRFERTTLEDLFARITIGAEPEEAAP